MVGRHARHSGSASLTRHERRLRAVGQAIVVVALIVFSVTLAASGAGIHERLLAGSWQLLELTELRDNLFQSLWYLHIQPPLYNLFVGGVLAWSPFPEMGTIFVVYILVLCVTGLLLHDLLMRWRVQPIVAAVIVAVALGNPSLLSTIGIAAYEVPVAAMIVGTIWCLQRFLDTPRFGWLLALSSVGTIGVLTRSLLNPVWILLLLGLAVVARHVTRRQALVAFAIPLVLAGAWMLKNQVVFGTPTMSSWLGFNLQRGVSAQMERSDVEADVRAGKVSSLALEYPWGALTQYREWTDGCRPGHDVAVLIEPRSGPADRWAART